jgi:hypothetical protein
MSTEMNSLANANSATSSAGGASGVFTNSNTAQGMFGEVFLKLGAIASACSAGANVAGWFLVSPDGGTTYENTVANTAQPRSPDFIIPLPATTITSGWSYKGSGPVMIPALKFKVFIMNNSGQTFAASANTIIIAPYAEQY